MVNNNKKMRIKFILNDDDVPVNPSLHIPFDVKEELSRVEFGFFHFREQDKYKMKVLEYVLKRRDSLVRTGLVKHQIHRKKCKIIM